MSDHIDEPVDVTVTIPDDLTALSADDLSALRAQAVEAFDALYESDRTAETVEAMSALADGIDRLRGEEDVRAEAAAEAAAAAEALAARVHVEAEEAAAEEEVTAEDATEEVAETETEVTGEEEEAVVVPDDARELEPVLASSKPAGPISVTVSGMARNRKPAPEPVEAQTGISLVASADLGRGMGAKLSLREAAEAWIDKSRGINYDAYGRAGNSKRTIQSFSLGSVHKQFSDDLRVTRDADADEVLKRAVDQNRLPGGSLVASAGWCSPSETLYELADAAETTDGVISLPEIAVDRGGLRHTLGPDFSDIFGAAGVSWNFTEDEVADGDYDGYGGGSKPTFFVECPDFVDTRLDVAGVGIKAGLLTNRAYPELIERVVSGALVAHEHAQSARKIADIVAGSTAVTFGSLFAQGAASPVLDAIEIQAVDYRQRHRLSDAEALEVVLPKWTAAAVRADLARRNGVMLTNVTDADVVAHLAVRGVVPQFVYGLDDFTGNAADRVSFPESVKFLIYRAGTWVGLTQAVITLESVFDSALVEQNIYTQLFTEEGWAVAKRFHDSRVVTVPICANGLTPVGNSDVDVSCGNGEG